MITVAELIKQLQDLNQPDLPVVTICEEDGNRAQGIKIITPENDFYYKGDSPLTGYKDN